MTRGRAMTFAANRHGCRTEQRRPTVGVGVISESAFRAETCALGQAIAAPRGLDRGELGAQGRDKVRGSGGGQAAVT